MAIAAVLLASGVEAATYKWVDETGQTVYSQSPPPSGSATRIERQAAPDPAEGERLREGLRREIEQSYDAAAEREQRDAQRQKAEAQRRTRAKNCEIARKNLAALGGLSRRQFNTPEGDYQTLTDDERQRRIREARDNIEKYCD
jgi:hypothetical protein